MDLLFISGVATGGAALSTIELARCLRARGHEARVLTTHRPPLSSSYGRLVRLHERVGSGKIRRGVRRLMRRIGNESSSAPEAPWLFHGTIAENAAQQMLEMNPADLVIVNSVPRFAARVISAECARRQIPFGLYLREAHSLSHFTVSRLEPDLVVANARHFVEELSRGGVRAHFIPSIVDVKDSKTTTNRRSVLLINPVEENRPDRFRMFAEARPNTNFVLQESWPLEPSARQSLLEDCESLPNLEFRARTAKPAEIYRDAALLVAPYPNGRPRVIVEAHANGIPVVALDQPALAELTTPEDHLLPMHASDGDWLAAIGTYLDDTGLYWNAVAAALAHASRAEVRPSSIARAFEEVAQQTLEAFRANPS